jgi:hypothetical protein
VATLRFGDEIEATSSDLLERPVGPAVRGSVHRVSLQPHGIRALFLRR